MKIVGVMRILNEDDIVESVIRHHLAMMDAIVLLDDGSNDRTMHIVNQLQEEGLPIHFISRPSIIYASGDRNTFLYITAVTKLRADWVVFLDADEFLDMRVAGCSLAEYLARLPERVEGLSIKLVNYIDCVTDDADELLIPRRMVWRFKEPHDVYKVMVKANTEPKRVTIHPGNHNAYLDGREISLLFCPDILLAHYPRRSGWHDIYKFVIGRLKINAAGKRETDRHTGSHYIGPFDIILNQPAELINNKSFFLRSPDNNQMVKNPIIYAGDPLRYTIPTDYKMKCISMVLLYANSLAQEYGKLMDTNSDVQNEFLKTLRLEDD